VIKSGAGVTTRLFYFGEREDNMSQVMVGVLCGVAAGVVVVIIALLRPAKKCPGCGEPLPKFRKPANSKQALWGGWTCPKCGCQIDRKGNKIEDKKTS
jgi:hypothetical protein